MSLRFLGFGLTVAALCVGCGGDDASPPAGGGGERADGTGGSVTGTGGAGSVTTGSGGASSSGGDTSSGGGPFHSDDPVIPNDPATPSDVACGGAIDGNWVLVAVHNEAEAYTTVTNSYLEDECQRAAHPVPIFHGIAYQEYVQLSGNEYTQNSAATGMHWFVEERMSEACVRLAQSIDGTLDAMCANWELEQGDDLHSCVVEGDECVCIERVEGGETSIDVVVENGQVSAGDVFFFDYCVEGDQLVQTTYVPGVEPREWLTRAEYHRMAQ